MPEPLRVLLADFHRGWGGQAAYVLNLARGLQGAGHGVTVACPPASELDRRTREAGIESFTGCDFRRGFRPLSFWHDLRALSAFVRRQKIQVVHTHGSQDCWRAAIFSRPQGCVHVRTKHNSYRVSNHFGNRWLYRKGIDRLIVVAGALKPLLGEILPPEKIEVLHAPVGERFFGELSGAEFRTEMNLDDDTPLLGVVARLVPDKGQDVLLRALPAIRGAHPGAVAVFAGDGSEYDRLKSMAADMNLSECARFLGPRKDIPELTAALDVAILPSTDCDASSTVIKEALASGTPVVATEIGGIREIVEDGVTGRIVPPGDPDQLAQAVIATLADRNAAGESARRGREIMRRQFSESVFVEKQLAIYRSVLESHSK